MTPDLNTALTALAIGGLGHVAWTLWKTVLVVERLDERSKDQEKRLDRVEQRVA
jgi:hypothetical protein